MEAQSVYVSSNCNQTPTGADCNENHLLAYGSCHAVLIYDLDAAVVVHTLIGHTKRVNSVRWIRGTDGELISGASDGSVVVWEPQGGVYASTFIQTAGGPTVNIVDGLNCNGRTIIAAAPMEPGVVRVWTRDASGCQFQPSETCQIGRSLCMGLRLGGTPASPLLACALEDSKILLLTETDQQCWIKGAVLSGHEDWVRGLDFVVNGQGQLLLASSSQDGTVRIWKLPEGGDAQLEAVLAGHEGWVYSVHWGPQGSQLLSASIDNSLIIWEPDEASGLWLENVRLGEVGGNVLGFYGGSFNGNRIVAHSYHGAFHIWTLDASGHWAPASKAGGHFDAIADLAWEPRGEFVYSAGVDQTVRIHGPWGDGWAEFARPQVHGYDMNALAVLGSFQYASGADEKIVRIFQTNDGELRGPKGAAVPSLGLSNKALLVDSGTDAPTIETPIASKAPPTEETLIENTLWPEIQKLYGHGNEIMALAASPDGRFLASACKASKPQQAGIFLWDTDAWKQIQELPGHRLTVVQMQFDPQSRRLLAVSRDRTWSLHLKGEDGRFALEASSGGRNPVHARIIWCCAWTHDSLFFATGSREGKLALWTEDAGKEPVAPLGRYGPAGEPLHLPNQSVTAVAFAPRLVAGGYLCAFGLETGTIDFYSFKGLRFERLLHLPQGAAHHMSVRRLAFRPQGAASEELQLCSGGSDSLLRIYRLIFTQ